MINLPRSELSDFEAIFQPRPVTLQYKIKPESGSLCQCENYSLIVVKLKLISLDMFLLRMLLD